MRVAQLRECCRESGRDDLLRWTGHVNKVRLKLHTSHLSYRDNRSIGKKYGL